MALEVVGSTPITHPTKYKLPAQGNTYHGTVFWDVAKLVRHRILIPAFGGSSPSSPAKNRQGSLGILSILIKVCNKVKSEKRESVLTNQLVRSGTSIGANIREAFYGHGKNDFIAKLQIALKECSESEYWIELLLESGYYDDKTLLDKCIEIKKMLIASVNTAKKNN